MAPTRIVLCGQTTQIGASVASSLSPEFEVIHFIQSVDAAKAELPSILAGKAPASGEANEVGTHDYSVAPRAVVLGRGFEISDAEDIQKATVGAAAEPVAWVISDPSRRPSGPPGPGYAEEISKIVKDTLSSWVAEGGNADGTLLY